MVQSWWFGLNPNLQHFKINIHYIMNIHYILYNTLSLKPSIFTPLISSKTVVIQSTAHNILPSFARVLAIKNTYAVLLPWQTNSIFIIFQVSPKMLSFTLICRAYQRGYFAPNSVTKIRNGAKYGKLMPSIVVKT